MQVSSMRRTSGCTTIGRRLAPDTSRRQRTALQALARVGERALGDVVHHRQSLQADREARGVHHGEHRHEALVRLPDQVALRAVEIDHAGRRAVDAHLVFDRAAAHRVALAHRAVARDLDLRHDEQRDALRARGRVRQAREHQVDDVVGEVVLAGGDEDLGAADGIGAIGGGLGARLQQAEVGTGVRFGQGTSVPVQRPSSSGRRKASSATARRAA
jgi:hypothetical protein